MIDLDISRYIELKGKGLIRIEQVNNGFEFFAARFDVITGDRTEASIGFTTKQTIMDFETAIDLDYQKLKNNIQELLDDLNAFVG